MRCFVIFLEQQCSTPDRTRGTCIDLRQCSSLFALIKKPNLTAAERNFLRESQCGYNNRYPWVSNSFQQFNEMLFNESKTNVCLTCFRFVVQVMRRLQHNHQRRQQFRWAVVCKQAIFRSLELVDLTWPIALSVVKKLKLPSSLGWFWSNTQNVNLAYSFRTNNIRFGNWNEIPSSIASMNVFFINLFHSKWQRFPLRWCAH